MATKEYLMDRVASFEAKIKKSEDIIEKKKVLLAKKQKQYEELTDENEKYWKKCEIQEVQGSINDNEKKINREFRPALEKYKAELAKVSSVVRDVKPILDFLEMWKEKCYEFCCSERVSPDRKRMRAEYNKLDKDITDLTYGYRKDFDTYNVRGAASELRGYGWRRGVSREELEKTGRYTSDELDKAEHVNELYSQRAKLEKEFNDRFGYVLGIEKSAEFHGVTFEQELDKTLTKDAEAKYDKIVADCNRYIGKVTDASNLRVSYRGELNGFLVGENGRCSVNSILAGGWNIQRLHVRCLIHKLKD